MNHREHTHRATGAGRTWRGPILLLLPTLACLNAAGMPRLPRVEWRVSASPDYSRAYLPTIGPAPLRFAVEPALPDPVVPPVVLEPSIPGDGTDDEPPRALVNEEQADTLPPGGETVSSETPPEKIPAGILLDDIRPAVRPEDLIPYFQIPGGRHQRGDLTLVVPVPHPAAPPPALPSSSATYTQTPQ